MMLFLVKWQDGTFALVSANDEDSLIDSLDQLGDPGVASWQLYEGPLWLEFPKVETSLPSEGDVDPFEINLGEGVAAETDQGVEFKDAVLAAVHPNLFALREKAMEQDRAITRDEFEKALRVDLAFALPGSIYEAAQGEEQ